MQASGSSAAASAASDHRPDTGDDVGPKDRPPSPTVPKRFGKATACGHGVNLTSLKTSTGTNCTISNASNVTENCASISDAHLMAGSNMDPGIFIAIVQ